MPDKKLLVEKPIYEVVCPPADMLGADVVEIRVMLTPMRWHTYLDSEKRELKPFGHGCYANYAIDRRIIIDSKDHRAIFRIIRELLLLLAREYLKLEL